MKMNIALVAHDEMKNNMVCFCIDYEEILKKYGIYATGTTGKRIMDETSLTINRLASGPLGGDQQIGSLIVQQEIDLVILQSRSPTCGVNQIYDGSFTGKLIPGMGLFAKALKQRGYNVIDVEEI